MPSAAAGALGDEFGVNKSRFFVSRRSVTSYWALNSLPGQPLANVKLRQAINWAIDRPAQVRVSGKYGGRRTDQILPPAMPGFIQQATTSTPTAARTSPRRRRSQGTSPTSPTLRDPAPATRPRTSTVARSCGTTSRRSASRRRPSRSRRAQLFTRAGDKKTANYDMPGDRLAGRLPGSVELHQRPARRAQHPGRGLEQQLPRSSTARSSTS